ncbi:hypothetical protein [Propionivibrio dicarboxylicus]|uniref:Uncharacterized protein n=1 Tax=Propionivibrio dicarboxylicus TaxID=83767 RepID=A0A1G8C9V4_9RHOO|nr:hypothetical protein [Propionivibrio dicarboxylicus]SDH42089.1 hypothetical protein SAMN05660652_01712 [Propionivibrio dicarboxylicus]
MLIPIYANDERSVEQATALFRHANYKIVGRVINGRVCLVLLPVPQPTKE